MQVVYMGTPEFAIPPLRALANSRHTISAVVTGPDKQSGRGRRVTATPVKVTAEELGIPVLTPSSLKDPNLVSELKALNADVFVVIAFRILPESIYTLPKSGSINIHGSLLPKYRGAAPIQRALMAGEVETGLSAFFLKSSVDTGDLIGQMKVSIEPDDTYTTLAGRMSGAAGEFLLKTLDQIESGSVKTHKQDDTKATPAPKIRADERPIDWSMSATAIVNKIRGMADTPGATAEIDGREFKILGARVSEKSGDLQSGEIQIAGKLIRVGAGKKTALELTRVQPAGKKVLAAVDLINGRFLQDGERFVEFSSVLHTDRKI